MAVARRCARSYTSAAGAGRGFDQTIASHCVATVSQKNSTKALRPKIRAPFIMAVAIALWFVLAPAHAQSAVGKSGRTYKIRPFGNIAKIFGDNPAFTTVCETTCTSTSSIPAPTAYSKVAYLEGKWRLEFDIGRSVSQSPSRANGPVSNRPTAHIDQSLTNLSRILIVRPDKQVVWQRTIRPDVTSMDGYFEDRLEEPTAAELDVDVKVAQLGTQTIDGHSCVVNNFTFTGGTGKIEQYTAWNATDLNKFPVRVEWLEGGKTNAMVFKIITLSADAALFEPPGSKKWSAGTLAFELLKALSSIHKGRTNSAAR